MEQLDTAYREAQTPIQAADYVTGIDTYLADAEQNDILRPHQDVIFRDLQEFLRDDGKKGYVTAPTGTGKTVIFVELSKALLEAGKTAGRTPKILVVEPTKDLVHQTLGRTGEKGYGEFAPDLHVTSFFSDSTEDDRRYLPDSDVVVTTYDSLSIMTRREEMRSLDDEEKEAALEATLNEIITTPEPGKAELTGQLERLDRFVRDLGQVATGRKLLDMFDVIILDEAHHVLGGVAASVVESLGRDKRVIGFTATPDANEKKRLDTHLPVKIHDLTFKEAIAMELLAPLATIGLRTHAQVQGGDLYDQEGDYQEGKLSYLASNVSRNRLITHAAKTLVEQGFGTIIPCIPGDGARHAIMLADELNRMGVSAAAIYGDGMTSNQRKEAYREFEKGNIDVLTNIRILGEGWDSTRAKAIVEASPTRSLISKRQRVGRVVRPGEVAVVVEIIDDYDNLNPPLHLADLLDSEKLESGQIYGAVTDEQRQRITELGEALAQDADIADTIPADYSKLAATLAEYQQIVSGRVASHKQGHFSVPEKISPMYTGVTDEIMTKLWHMKGREPDVTLGRQSYNIRMLYDVGTSMQLLREVPVCEQDRAYIVDDERWISAEGFVIGFNKKYPQLDAALMEDLLHELGDTVEWRPLKSPVSGAPRSMVEYEAFKAYHANEQTISTLDKQLRDYFEIIEKSPSK